MQRAADILYSQGPREKYERALQEGAPSLAPRRNLRRFLVIAATPLRSPASATTLLSGLERQLELVEHLPVLWDGEQRVGHYRARCRRRRDPDARESVVAADRGCWVSRVC